MCLFVFFLSRCVRVCVCMYVVSLTRPILCSRGSSVCIVSTLLVFLCLVCGFLVSGKLLHGPATYVNVKASPFCVLTCVQVVCVTGFVVGGISSPCTHIHICGLEYTFGSKTPTTPIQATYINSTIPVDNRVVYLIRPRTK